MRLCSLKQPSLAKEISHEAALRGVFSIGFLLFPFPIAWPGETYNSRSIPLRFLRCAGQWRRCRCAQRHTVDHGWRGTRCVRGVCLAYVRCFSFFAGTQCQSVKPGCQPIVFSFGQNHHLPWSCRLRAAHQGNRLFSPGVRCCSILAGLFLFFFDRWSIKS